jgi:hypothetical protein
VCTFAAIPAVVAAARHHVHFFEQALADIGHPQIAIGWIETPAPGIAQAVGVDLGTCAAGAPGSWTHRIAGEGIRGRDGVRRGAVNIDAEHLAEHRGESLAVASRVATATAIANADI